MRQWLFPGDFPFSSLFRSQSLGLQSILAADFLLRVNKEQAAMASPRWWSKDTTAVVTGANKGIGYEIVRKLAKEDVRVILTARNKNLGMFATEKLQAEGLNVDFHPLDVCSIDSIGNLVQYIKEKYASIDILVNNAGIADYENAYEKGRVIIETNYVGAKNVTKMLLPLLRPSTSGARIVNVSSQMGQLKRLKNATLIQQMANIDNLSEEKIDAFLGQFLDDFKLGNLESKGWPKTFSAYCVSKIALNASTRVLARELTNHTEGQKIYVNAMAPGYVKTDMTKNAGILPPEEGADTAVWLSLLPSGGPSGQFFYQRKYLEF